MDTRDGRSERALVREAVARPGRGCACCSAVSASASRSTRRCGRPGWPRSSSSRSSRPSSSGRGRICAARRCTASTTRASAWSSPTWRDVARDARRAVRRDLPRRRQRPGLARPSERTAAIYADAGLRAPRAGCSRPGGRLTVWAAAADAEFEARLRRVLRRRTGRRDRRAARPRRRRLRRRPRWSLRPPVLDHRAVAALGAVGADRDHLEPVRPGPEAAHDVGRDADDVPLVRCRTPRRRAGPGRSRPRRRRPPPARGGGARCSAGSPAGSGSRTRRGAPSRAGCGRSGRRRRWPAPPRTPSTCFRFTIVCRLMACPSVACTQPAVLHRTRRPAHRRRAYSSAISSSVVTVVQLRAVAVTPRPLPARPAHSFDRATPVGVPRVDLAADRLEPLAVDRERRELARAPSTVGLGVQEAHLVALRGLGDVTERVAAHDLGELVAGADDHGDRRARAPTRSAPRIAVASRVGRRVAS